MNQNEPKSRKGERGRETLFRVTYQHQSKLIQIADYKANMNMSLNTMIISAIIAILGYGIVSGQLVDLNTYLMIPVIGIVGACLVSLVFAIQAARPKLLKTKKATDPNQKSSLLFFGEIASHSQADYIERMKELISSDHDMYEHMTIDLHNQGMILKRKYDLLLISYQVLMYGFIFSVLLFMLMLLIYLM
ncbi:MAG: Pycsar system effector family protein [Saprospiraceae bacterium]